MGEAYTYTCANCGGCFAKGWSDEEAAAEACGLIPDEQLKTGLEVVCDDCFKAIMGRVQIEAPELLRPGAAPVPGACYRTPGGTPVHVRRVCRCPR